MAKQSKIIKVENFEIVLYTQNSEDFISLTDMAKYRDAERTNYIIQNWLRTRNAIEFCGLWELINNPNFKGIEFDAFKNESAAIRPLAKAQSNCNFSTQSYCGQHSNKKIKVE